MMRSPSLRSMRNEVYDFIGSGSDTADPRMVRAARRAVESSLESLRVALGPTAARRERLAERRLERSPAHGGRWVAVGAVTALCTIALGVRAARRARARGRSEEAGAWKQIRGKLKERWSELTDDDIERLSGQGEQLAGKLQLRYGMAREDAERQVQEFRSRHRWY
jgi:uncharacterized protein YjbJ (UPF0337 family)